MVLEDPNPTLARPTTGTTGAISRGPVGFGLVVEYLMFASAVFLALLLFATRVPLRVLDTTFGLHVRERFVDFLARVSPG